jgi:hypothetical protein
VSRRVHWADVAVSSDGTVLLNVAHFDDAVGLERMLKMAMGQRGEVFIGVALSPKEKGTLLRSVELVLPNATGPIVGRRQCR